MKKNLFLVLMSSICLSVFAQSNSTDNLDLKTEKTEKRIIVKKIVREGGNGHSDEEIQKMVEAELKAAEGQSGNQEIRIFLDEDGNQQKVIMNGDQKVIVLNNEDHNAHDFNFKNHCTKANVECDPNKAVMGVVLRNAGGSNGASIERVFEGSGASKAGLQEGDILLKINSSKVIDVESAIEALSGLKVDDKVKVSYLRNGETQKTTISLGVCTPDMCKPACPRTYGFDSKEFKQQMRESAEELKVEALKLKEKAKELKEELELELKQKKESSQNESTESLEISYLSGTPNPNQGQLRISYSGEKGPIQVSVIDLNGKEIYSEKVADFSGKYEKEINLENAKGTVILKITQGSKMLKEKIIIE
ncbi:MAG: PDZ domain-containing protein [Saprospiraceae bacterium]|nr:PDZ domain-containing protein [Saprospiraceae bacterium]MBK7810224.1 PDZ domain-containing protein [Saprospiraceae bacterium]MBK9629827.1 PDZ domain-containing protein [Saprospiraceae bacterium]